MFVKRILAVAAVVAASFAAANGASAQEYGNGHVSPLFANQYTQGGANQATAQMYVAPVPVPPWVGHTDHTYQPFYPHEMMYWHGDRYHNYYDNGRGLNRTSVHYYSPPVRTVVHGIFNSVSIARPW